MKKIIVIYVCLIGIYFSSYSQITLNEGAALIFENAYINIHSMAIDIQGDIFSDSVSVGIFYGKNSIESNHSLSFSTLRLQGDLNLDVDTLYIKNVHISKGRLDIADAYLSCVALSGETNKSYIYSSTGQGILASQLKNLLPNKRNTVLGLSLLVDIYIDSLKVERRFDNSQFKKTDRNIGYYYTLYPPIHTKGIDLYSYYGVEDANVGLYSQSSTGEWLSHADLRVQKNETVFVLSTSQGYPQTAKIVLFPFPKLEFSKILTPNGDGINDCFEVQGIEQYPQSHLIIFSKTGEKKYDKMPYDNSFCGEKLSQGTYYYMFYPDKVHKNNVVKSFFELVQ